MSNLQSNKERKGFHYGIAVLLLFSVAIMLSACTLSPVGQGLIVTNVKGPLEATQNEGHSKVGYSSCTNVLGLVAAGDSSITAAMKQGGISRIHHVDYRIRSVFIFFSIHTTIVYGE